MTWLIDTDVFIEGERGHPALVRGSDFQAMACPCVNPLRVDPLQR